MAASGNSMAVKSFQSFVVNAGLLAKVVEAVKAGEKDARTSGVVKSFEIFYAGFRQNISIGRIFIVPAKVCDTPQNFPVALLYGTVVRELNLGEETADLITKKMGDNEFDEFSQISFSDIKDKFFMGEDGKTTSLVVFAPNWSNIREYVAFKYTDDDEKLSNLLRHQVFASYFNPAVSSAFDALMTTVDTHKLDITDITPKLTHPFLTENPLRAFPELVKQGNWNPEKIFLTAKTADAITQEMLDPQELNVFEALDSALTEATLPAVEDMDDVADYKGPNGSNHGNADIPEIDAINQSLEVTKEAAGKSKVWQETYDESIQIGRSKENAKARADQAVRDEEKEANEAKNAAMDDGTELRHRPDYGEKGSYTQEQNEEAMKMGGIDAGDTCADCGAGLDAFKTCPNTDPKDAARGIKTCGKGWNKAAGEEDDDDTLCEACHKPHAHHHKGYASELCRKCCDQCNKKKLGSEAPFEVPFTNVGPGTSAHDNANKAIAVKVDTISTKGDAPIGIELDETGLPVHTAKAKLKPGQEMDGDKKKTRCKSCGAFLVKGKCPVSAKDCGRNKKASSEGSASALGLLNQYFDSLEHPIALIESALKVLGDENPEAAHEIHQGLAENDPEWAQSFFDNARGMLMRAPQQDAQAAHVARAVAKNLTHEYDAVSTKTKAAKAAREVQLNKYATRRKMADVPLTEDSIWNDLMEDFGEAPQVELPGEGSAPKADSEDESAAPKMERTEDKSKPLAEQPKTEEPKKDGFKSKMFNNNDKKEEPKPKPNKAEEPTEEKKEASVKTGSWMNGGEVEEAVYRFAQDPILGPVTKFLHDFMEQVNDVSDGWHSWPLPARAASQLMDLIQSAPRGGFYDEYSPSSVTVQQVAKAMAPIKAFMTRRGLAAGMVMPSLVIKTKKMASDGVVKKADDVSGDISEAKSEVVSPATVDPTIAQPVVSVEEAAKVAKTDTNPGDPKYREMQREKQQKQLREQEELLSKEKAAADVSGDLAEAKSELDAGAKAELADSPEATQTVNPDHFAAAGDEHDEEVEMSLGMGDLADLAANLPHQDMHTGGAKTGSYSSKNFKSKKDLKEAVARGEKISIYNPGMGEAPMNGPATLEGPWYPRPHTWYASVVMQDGIIVKVK